MTLSPDEVWGRKIKAAIVTKIIEHLGVSAEVALPAAEAIYKQLSAVNLKSMNGLTQADIDRLPPYLQAWHRGEATPEDPPTINQILEIY